ncbi:unnamed protein product [Orchesella dallaii]|uniref:Uncharacterized protein n=1 Tax=Orchesella dallaii TaxID=48710 RepID=A0ABP1QWZ4_9HEXA
MRFILLLLLLSMGKRCTGLLTAMRLSNRANQLLERFENSVRDSMRYPSLSSTHPNMTEDGRNNLTAPVPQFPCGYCSMFLKTICNWGFLSSGAPNVDLLLTDDIVESVFKNDENSPPLPVGDDSPYGIVLLFSSSLLPLKQFTMPKINGKYREIPLTEFFKRIIRTHSQDIVVYARKAPVERRDIFEHPTSFQRDTESPGQQNPCRGAFIFTEDIIDEVAPLVPPGPEEMEVTACTPSETNVPQARFTEINQNLLAATVATAMEQAKDTCMVEQGGATDFVQEEGMEAMNREIRKRSTGTPSTPLYL